MRRAHIHWFRYVKTGIDFTYTTEQIMTAPLALQPLMAFAGPVRHLYRCRCGATELRK